MKLLATLILAIGFLRCQSQNKYCYITLGEVYKSLKSIDTEKKEKLTYKKYRSFDFKYVKPVYGDINELDYFEVGYSQDYKLSQIIHHDSLGGSSYLMNVYDFDKYKIMTLVYDTELGYKYMPVVFVMTEHYRWMLTLVPITGGNDFQYGGLFMSFPMRPIEDISSIMALDENMKTTKCVIAHEGIVQISYEIEYYPNSDSINYELARVFLTTKKRKGHKLDEYFCLNELDRFLERADFSFITEPRNYKIKGGLPLWMYGGTEWHK